MTSIIYALIDLSKPGRYQSDIICYLYEPYYIGKGSSEDRPKSHKFEALRKKNQKGSRTYKQNKILDLLNNNVPYEYVMVECENENDALNKECYMIDLFGCYINGGILTNIHIGGGGNIKGYVYCVDKNNQMHYVKNTDERIGKSLQVTGFGEQSIMCIDDGGNVYKVPKDQFDSSLHKNMHFGRKRSDTTKKSISEGKLKYKFTKDHLENISKANKVIALTVHTGAKRKEKTKTAISKSRYGSKSKVANTWRLTSPNGDIVVYRGGLKLAEELFQINGNRLIRYEGGIVPYPNYTGHKNERVYNTTGWKLEKNPSDCVITFEFIFIG